MKSELVRKLSLEAAVIEQHINEEQWIEAQHRTQNLLEMLREKNGKMIVRYRGGGVYE